MSKLEDIVPPLDLCKQIPAGHFADSALVWFGHDRQDDMEVCPREELGPACMTFVDKGLRAIYPAPTLAEILREMASYPNRFRMVTVEVDKPEETTVVAEFPDKWNPGGKLHEEKDENGALAAQKLWLEQKAKK